jgi:hypothetical protein
MSTFIEYELADGTKVLVEISEPKSGGITKASKDKVGNVIASASQTFEDAFAGVKKSAQILRQQLEEMKADEVEVTFGLKATGEFGNFAIGQVGAEANYTVKMKWNNKPANNG